jgi:hypothetical protein
MKKPIGTIISKNRAQEISSHWHSGQWSALYSFASSKSYVEDYYVDYINEIDKCIPFNLKQKSELYSLKRFFEYKNWESSNKLC